ncbi:alpha/beta hydrolase fold domain-containing protein [Amycolatopsis sp. NPDC051758]|uniref:alpha/beta hydrolase fold domain-containing protein n=1 Tax=Amycolatopsis sp. NPDC051758 TaxID=3363935 RepID=UPI0037884A42
MPIHPAVAAKLPLLDGVPSFEALVTDPAFRDRMVQFMTPSVGNPPPVVKTREETAAGVHVRVYSPSPEDADGRPCLVWLHGGAFKMGDLDMPEADWVAREVVTRTGATVVSVDYRLAIPYPAPHDDVVAAVRWVRDALAPSRVVLGGASAGGNLAAGAALRLRDDDGWVPAELALVYPVLHPELPPPSASLTRRMAEVPPILHFPPDEVRTITEDFLGGPASSADGYAMPGLAVLEGLCPTLLLTAEYDDLRPSGEKFAAALALAGVDVRHVQIPSMLHGFLGLPSAIEPVDQALRLVAGLLA